MIYTYIGDQAIYYTHIGDQAINHNYIGDQAMNNAYIGDQAILILQFIAAARSKRFRADYTPLNMNSFVLQYPENSWRRQTLLLLSWTKDLF